MGNENTKPLKESVSITLDADLLQELRKEALSEVNPKVWTKK